MLKKNFTQAAERNKLFLKRKLTDGILFRAHVSPNPYAVAENRDRTWRERECLAVSDPGWVLENERRKALVCQDVDDDTITEGYPTLHFGESLCSALLGGKITYVGSEYHTCSGAEPLIACEADFDKLPDFADTSATALFTECIRRFAAGANGDFWLKYFITVDALNLAVELAGTTAAYEMVYENPRLLHRIMEFGVEFNDRFYRLQKQEVEANTRAALGDAELYELYDKTWHSVDAYTICFPSVYREMGLEYQRALLARVGGGMLHTHGTGLRGLLPEIAKLDGLSSLQIGRDLNAGGQLPFGIVTEARKITGDMPLRTTVGVAEFENGLRGRTLPGGVEYTCWVSDVAEANRLARMAKDYKAQTT